MYMQTAIHGGNNLHDSMEWHHAQGTRHKDHPGMTFCYSRGGSNKLHDRIEWNHAQGTRHKDH